MQLLVLLFNLSVLIYNLICYFNTDDDNRKNFFLFLMFINVICIVYLF